MPQGAQLSCLLSKMEKENIEKEIKEAENEEKRNEKKKENEEKIEEKKARVYVKDAPVSTKHCVAICRFIKNKNPKEAIQLLEQVLKKKIAVPMKGEIPHRKIKIKGQRPEGRYPQKATKVFIKALKNLIANAKVKGLDQERLYICLAKADKASRPIRATRIAFGIKRFKRTHILIEAKEKND